MTDKEKVSRGDEMKRRPMALSSQSKINSVLNRLPFLASPDSSAITKQTNAFSPIQDKVDGMMSRFIDEATEPCSLTALMVGGIAYRLGKIGVMSMGVGGYGRAPAIFASTAVGLGSEVTAFELTKRTLHSLRAGLKPAPTQNLWNWSGLGGWKQGLLNDLIAFGLLKGAGHLSRESNIIFQHAFSSTAMVAGLQTASFLGIMSNSEESLAEQFLHAEMTNIQLSAGTSLGHVMAPGIFSMERGLDFSFRLKIAPPFFQRGGREDLALAEGIDNIRTTFAAPRHNANKNLHILHMATPDDSESSLLAVKISQLEIELPSGKTTVQNGQPGVLFEKPLEELYQNTKIVTHSPDGQMQISLQGKKNLNLQDVFEFYQLIFHHGLKSLDIIERLKKHGREIQTLEPHVHLIDRLLQDAREPILNRRLEPARRILEEVERQFKIFELTILGIAVQIQEDASQFEGKSDFLLDKGFEKTISVMEAPNSSSLIDFGGPQGKHSYIHSLTGEKDRKDHQETPEESSISPEPSPLSSDEKSQQDLAHAKTLPPPLEQTVISDIKLGSAFDHTKILEDWRSNLGEFLLGRLRKRHARYFGGGSEKIHLSVGFDSNTKKINEIDVALAPPPEGATQLPFVTTISYNIGENRFEVTTLPHRKGLGPYGPWKNLIRSLDGNRPLFLKFAPPLDEESYPEGELQFYGENRDYAAECLGMMTVGRQTLDGNSFIFRTETQFFDAFLSVAPNGYFVGLRYRITLDLSPRGTFYEIGLPQLGTLTRIDYSEYENSLTKESLKVPEKVTWESTPNNLQQRAIDLWMRRLGREIEKPGWSKRRLQK